MVLRAQPWEPRRRRAGPASRRPRTRTRSTSRSSPPPTKAGAWRIPAAWVRERMGIPEPQGRRGGPDRPSVRVGREPEPPPEDAAPALPEFPLPSTPRRTSLPRRTGSLLRTISSGPVLEALNAAGNRGRVPGACDAVPSSPKSSPGILRSGVSPRGSRARRTAACEAPRAPGAQPARRPAGADPTGAAPLPCAEAASGLRPLDGRLARGARERLHRGEDDPREPRRGGPPRARQGHRAGRDVRNVALARRALPQAPGVEPPRAWRGHPDEIEAHLRHQHARRPRGRAVGAHPASEGAPPLPRLPPRTQHRAPRPARRLGGNHPPGRPSLLVDELPPERLGLQVPGRAGDGPGAGPPHREGRATRRPPRSSPTATGRTPRPGRSAGSRSASTPGGTTTPARTAPLGSGAATPSVPRPSSRGRASPARSVPRRGSGSSGAASASPSRDRGSGSSSPTPARTALPGERRGPSTSRRRPSRSARPRSLRPRRRPGGSSISPRPSRTSSGAGTGPGSFARRRGARCPRGGGPTSRRSSTPFARSVRRTGGGATTTWNAGGNSSSTSTLRVASSSSRTTLRGLPEVDGPRLRTGRGPVTFRRRHPVPPEFMPSR